MLYQRSHGGLFNSLPGQGREGVGFYVAFNNLGHIANSELGRNSLLLTVGSKFFSVAEAP